MRLPWVLVVILSVLLVGYVVNDRVMAWDEDQKVTACTGTPIEDMLTCWEDHDRYPIDF